MNYTPNNSALSPGLLPQLLLRGEQEGAKNPPGTKSDMLTTQTSYKANSMTHNNTGETSSEQN